MWVFRHLPGYVVMFVLAGVGIALTMLAWQGWSLALGWPWALATAGLSLAARFNGYMLVGAYFFAYSYLHWPPVQCFAMAALGLMFITPGVVAEIYDMFTGRHLKPDE